MDMPDRYLDQNQPRNTFIAVEPYEIGRFSYVGEFSHISQNTYIGNFCSIGNLCTIGAQQHPYRYLTSFPFEEILSATEQKITLVGSDSWVGCNSVILSGVKVGAGAVIGAGAIVTKDVPPFAIVAGNPAKVLTYRFDHETIVGLLETHWWDLPVEVIKKLPMLDPVACIAKIRAMDRPFDINPSVVL